MAVLAQQPQASTNATTSFVGVHFTSTNALAATHAHWLPKGRESDTARHTCAVNLHLSLPVCLPAASAFSLTPLPAISTHIHMHASTTAATNGHRATSPSATTDAHPLDPLSPAEIAAAAEACRQLAAGQIGVQELRYNVITLKEPPKAELLAFEAGGGERPARQAFAILQVGVCVCCFPVRVMLTRGCCMSMSIACSTLACAVLLPPSAPLPSAALLPSPSSVAAAYRLLLLLPYRYQDPPVPAVYEVTLLLLPDGPTAKVLDWKTVRVDGFVGFRRVGFTLAEKWGLFCGAVGGAPVAAV